MKSSLILAGFMVFAFSTRSNASAYDLVKSLFAPKMASAGAGGSCELNGDCYLSGYCGADNHCKDRGEGACTLSSDCASLHCGATGYCRP